MGKLTWDAPPKRDDPIFKEGWTVFTPRLVRASTPSTKKSPKSTASGSGPGSKGQTDPAAGSKSTSTKEA